MPDVRLTITADTEGYVRGVKDAQRAHEDFNKRVREGTKRDKESVEDLMDQLKKLKDAWKNAYNVADIDKYQRKIEEVEKKLRDYHTTATKSAEATESIGQKIGGALLRFGGLIAILNKVKDAFAETVQGINLFNNIAAVTRQAFNDLVNGIILDFGRMHQALKIQQELNAARLKEYQDNILIARANRQFQEAYTASVDQTLSDSEKLLKIDEALAAHNRKLKLQIGVIKEELDAYRKLVEMNPTNEKNLKRFYELVARYEEIQASAASEVKRLMSRKTGLEEAKQKEDRKRLIEAWHKEIEADNAAYAEKLRIQKQFQDLSKKLLDDYDRSMIASLEGAAKLKAQRDFELRQIAEFKSYIQQLGQLSDIQEEQFKTLVQNVYNAFNKAMVKYVTISPEQKDAISKALIGNLPDLPGLQKSYIQQYQEDPYGKISIWKLIGIDEESEEGMEQIEAFKRAAGEIKRVIDDVFAKRVEDARRNRELMDQRIVELQNSINTEAILTRDGYASNVSLKKQELEALKKERQAALIEEEKAIKRQRSMEAISQTVSLMSSAANLTKSLTSKAGVVGLVLAATAIASLFAMWANVKSKATNVTRLATGGSGDDTGIIKGRRHYQGGERFTDNIEVEEGEAWGVLNRRASGRYGKVFHDMVESFNRGMIPEVVAPSVNVAVDTKGTNRRLDAVKAELVKANTKKEIVYSGNRKIIRFGNSVRIINK